MIEKVKIIMTFTINVQCINVQCTMFNVQCSMYNVLVADLVKLFGCGCYLMYNVLLCICSMAAIFGITRISCKRHKSKRGHAVRRTAAGVKIRK